MSGRKFSGAVLVLWGACALTTPPATAQQGGAPRMTVVVGKDVSGAVYKKLGLPERHFCWDTCLKEERCSGVRWGVVAGDTAGLCMLLTGPLSIKDLVEPQTSDGKPIHVTGARKEVSTGSGT
ncbi:MAG TPA: hypothetical protein VGC34_07705 [Steroidobacteraceae bacterium]